MLKSEIKIAVLSGKGGTGKTLVSVNLAAVAAEANLAVTYVDCDVEEPNGHLFFKPQNIITQPITKAIPEVNAELCTGCRTCVSACKFNALAFVAGKIRVFEEVCHSCGACMVLCPEKAMEESPRPIGRIEVGESQGVRVLSGFMNPGEASGVPIIGALLQASEDSNLLSYTSTQPSYTFIDCPPGSACSAMESLKGADFCVLVAEPTIFGVHNLAMVHELVKLFNIPYGVVLNKVVQGEENPAKEFCLSNGIQILEEIPYDPVLGSLNSQGEIAAKVNPDYNSIFKGLLDCLAQNCPIDGKGGVI